MKESSPVTFISAAELAQRLNCGLDAAAARRFMRQHKLGVKAGRELVTTEAMLQHWQARQLAERFLPNDFSTFRAAILETSAALVPAVIDALGTPEKRNAA